MYKNLDPEAIGLSCSQNELIELTLTHRFRGLSLEFDSFQRDVDENGLAHTIRFLKSAPIRISTAALPFNLSTSEGKFRARMVDLPKFVESAKALGCDTFFVVIAPGSIDQPYHENFELHRQRIAELAESLNEHEMQLGLSFRAAAIHRVGLPNPFVNSPDGLVALLKTCVANNLGIVVDVWDWTVGGGTAELLDGLTANQIVDVRLADLPVGFDAETVEDADRLVPGSTGTVDVGSFIRVLSSMQYKGPVTAVPHGSQLDGRKKDAVVQTLAESIDRALADPEEAASGAVESDGAGLAAGADGA